ncbi:MAG: MurR/RpiR family transcriptional regulator [Ilumatobacteraceae bacterium]
MATVIYGPTWDQIRAATPSLARSQRRVAEALLSMPIEELAAASANDVAGRSDSSAATVVRTCQQLGFSGFRECAMRLALDVDVSDIDGDSGGATGADDRPSTFLHGVATVIKHAASAVDDDALAAVGTTLAGASRILIAGFGWSAAPAMHLGYRLASLGLPVDSSTDMQHLVMVATTLRPGDACVVVCRTGGSRVTQNLAELAHERGAAVVLVSTFSHSLTAAHADHNIIFGGLDGGETHPRHPAASVVQFATMEAINLAVETAIGVHDAAAVRARLPALIDIGV